jgi:hypothetical protein
MRCRLRVAAFIALAGCTDAPARDLVSVDVPDRLHGLVLVERMSGSDAQQLIALLHPGPLAPAESRVGFYAAGEQRAVLYVSRFPSEEAAAEQLGQMASAIGHGRAGFGSHTEADIGGTVVHSVVGQGRTHYFYVRDGDVVWLAADAGVAQMALTALFGTGPDSIIRQ